MCSRSLPNNTSFHSCDRGKDSVFFFFFVFSPVLNYIEMCVRAVCVFTPNVHLRGYAWVEKKEKKKKRCDTRSLGCAIANNMVVHGTYKKKKCSWQNGHEKYIFIYKLFLSKTRAHLHSRSICVTQVVVDFAIYSPFSHVCTAQRTRLTVQPYCHLARTTPSSWCVSLHPLSFHMMPFYSVCVRIFYVIILKCNRHKTHTTHHTQHTPKYVVLYCLTNA